MSLSGALSNAMSGLVANARATTVVSSNIANALNDHYGKRDVSLAANAIQTSGGVVVAQVTRHSDPILAFQKRMAFADHSANVAHAAFQSRFENLVGSIDTTGSIAERLTQFETALISAASDPSSQTRLRHVSFTADAFASTLRQASSGLDDLRSNADAKIAKAVSDINAGLLQLEELNAQIMTAKYRGQDDHGLRDRRDAVLEAVSEHVPLHVIERDSGVIAVFTAQGRTLLDEQAVTLGFIAKPVVAPHMRGTNGLLSQLTIGGKAVDIPGSGMLGGGSLEAHFRIRDEFSVTAMDQLDAIARDVIERFAPGGPDMTLGPGDPGVFTDAGFAFDPIAEVGIAGRIRLNETLSTSGTETWRWRDGLNAVQPADVGQSDLLGRLQAEVSASRIPASPVLGNTQSSLVDHLHGLSNDVAADRLRWTDMEETSAAQLADLRRSAAEGGVNTDQELQKLIELEKSYAANARVVQIVDDMLSELLRI